MNQSSLLEAVTDVARLAGSIALARFGGSLKVLAKNDGSPVTDADLAAERAARAWIEERFPDHGIVGEELGVRNPEAELRWLIDPIDGTQSYVRGVPLWGTLVAIARGDDVLAGAIHCPAANEMLCAAAGEGCWWNGARARVSSVSSLSQAMVLTTDERFGKQPDRATRWKALASRARLSRGWGDCYGYLLVATGRAEAMVDPVLSPWDAAALYAVVSEAGGVITDWLGRVSPYGEGAVATNATLSKEVRSVLQVAQPSPESLERREPSAESREPGAESLERREPRAESREPEP
jgi:histidinol-phosphatase